MPELVIQSHRGPYRVRFGPLFEGLRGSRRDGEHLIVDRTVAELYSRELSSALDGPSVLRIEATETNKSIEKIPAYVVHLLDRGIRRNHCLTAVGGGIIQDITAFIAATLFRGIPWRFFPTTLLAQADSCIGSKSSINVGSYKNQMGTFTPPDEVAISTEVMGTLSEPDLRSGIGEMLKVHILAGAEDTAAIARDYPRLLEDAALLERYIYRSLEIKKAKVEDDEFDRGSRLVMNYGHSFGHAIESATAYGIPHGIAVTIGMDLANYVSWELGHTTAEIYSELHSMLAPNCQGFVDVEIPEDKFFQALRRDKKNLGSEVSLILLRRPGELFLQRCSLDDRLRRICTDYLKNLKSFPLRA